MFEQPISFAVPSKIVEIPSRRPPLRTGDCECYRDQKRPFLDNYSELFGIEQELTYILTRALSDDGQSPWRLRYSSRQIRLFLKITFSRENGQVPLLRNETDAQVTRPHI